MARYATVAFDFADKIVVVTGGGSGIGLGIADAFARAGATIVIVERLITGVTKRFGRLDIVVSNAAVIVPGEITEVSTADWEALRQTNIDGFFYLAKSTLPLLAASRGTVIATGSVSGLAGDWKNAIYDASKGAVSQFVRALALDWGVAASGSTRWRRRSSCRDGFRRGDHWRRRSRGGRASGGRRRGALGRGRASWLPVAPRCSVWTLPAPMNRRLPGHGSPTT